MSGGRAAVVVLTWNRREDVLACLDSLRDDLGPGDAVLVVDNGSSDGTEAAVRQRHPGVELLQAGANLGFAAGNNLGIRRALERGFEWVLLLNDDTLVPKGTLDALVGYLADRPEVGVVQPLLVRAADPGVIDSSGQQLTRGGGAFDRQMGRPAGEAPSEAGPVFGACAAASLFRARVLREAGLFDEGFFALHEEMDLMFRVRSLGFDVHLLPSVRVLHRRGISVGSADPDMALRREYWLRRNGVALQIRYLPPGRLLLLAPLLAWNALLSLRLGRRVPGSRCLPLWWRSLRERGRCRRGMRRHGVDRWFPSG